MTTRESLVLIVNGYLPEPQASLLNGMVLGVPLEHSSFFYEQLKKVGLLHLVVLSGTNISLLVNLLTSLTHRFGKIISILITTLCLLFFMSIISPEAPILRAFLSTILTFVSIIFKRKTHALFLLLVTAILTHFFIHEALKTISFQLSYGATLGILLLRPQLSLKDSAFIHYCKESLWISVAAQFFTAPIIFIYFKQISFISPLSNLFIGWTVLPIMIFGFMTMILGAVSHTLGLIPALICYGLLKYCVVTVEILSSIPFAFRQF